MGQPLEGKVILVTGASRGIGFEIAREVGRAGASVVAHYAHTRHGAEEATAELPSDRKLLVHGDFAETRAGNGVWEQAVGWKGRVDVLVNNAAILTELDWDGPEDEWDRIWQKTWQVNVIEPGRITRAAVRHFVENGEGTVISLSRLARIPRRSGRHGRLQRLKGSAHRPHQVGGRRLRPPWCGGLQHRPGHGPHRHVDRCRGAVRGRGRNRRPACDGGVDPPGGDRPHRGVPVER